MAARCAGLFLGTLLWLALATASPRQLQPAPPIPDPAFTLPATDGTTHSLAAPRDRTVLVHFFATWCEPCREELASLSHLARTSSTTLSVVAVNVAEVPVRVRRFLDTTPVDFPVLLDTDRTITRAWGVAALPTTFVLDRKLVARLFVAGDVDWTRPDIRAALDEISAGDQSTQGGTQ
jgi:peroxiredoxin